MTMRKIYGVLFAALAALVLGACSDGGGGGASGSAGGTITDTDTSALSGVTLALGDAVSGFAGEGSPSYATTGGTTVRTRAELLEALSAGGVIYIDGMIDMTDVDGAGTMLPPVGGGTTAVLDAFVNEQTGGAYATYGAFQSAYVNACAEDTEDKSSSAPQSELGETLWALNKAYGEVIKVTVPSGTTLIGKSATSGIRGGTIQIVDGAENVQIRNLTISDAYDPFPHHEDGDGYNAQWDGISIDGAKHVWIDHCTLQDRLTPSYVVTGGSVREKWQTYDGLCDIKGDAEYITVSYCKFKNHDKTMLIGSSDDEDVKVTRTVTLHHNYFYNCGQRLPMVRKTNIHLYNNYYAANDPHYSQQYAVGVRYKAKVVSESNYFGAGIKYSYSGSSATAKIDGDVAETVVYFSLKPGSGDVWGAGVDENGAGKYFTAVAEKPFTPSYTYTPDKATTLPSALPSQAGAGATVQ